MPRASACSVETLAPIPSIAIARGTARRKLSAVARSGARLVRPRGEETPQATPAGGIRGKPGGPGGRAAQDRVPCKADERDGRREGCSRCDLGHPSDDLLRAVEGQPPQSTLNPLDVLNVDPSGAGQKLGSGSR